MQIFKRYALALAIYAFGLLALPVYAQTVTAPYINTVIAATGVAASTTGDTVENTLATITVPAMGPRDILIIRTLWTVTNSVNTKTMRVKFGSFTAYARGETAIASNEKMTIIQNRGATNSQVAWANNATGFSTSANANTTGAQDTTGNVTLLITGQNGLAAETITLEAYYVELLRAP